MSSERGGLFKNRAETFARHLQTRLKSLNKSEEDTWTAETSSSDEVYYDINSSLASPEEEAAEPIFVAEQNRDILLQRTDSSGSQYFDTVESLEEESAPSLKQIPILHLKTDRPSTLVNGCSDVLDVDAGCSIVREIPFLELNSKPPEKGNTENNCDSDSLLENNNICKNIEELGLDIQPCNCDEAVVIEVDTRPTEDVDEEVSESTNSSSCIFCDIEQIKSSLSNTLENTTSPEVNMKNGNCKTNDLENDHPEMSNGIETNHNRDFSPDEEGVSLTDLLQVLKNEISSEAELNRAIIEIQATTIDSSESSCPSIEVRGSSPEEKCIKEVIEDEDEVFDIETKRKNFRRCSSLKTGKTPPGTPGRKKIVRFADVLGLDLADVKTFLDEVPTIPKSAYEDLHGINLSSTPGMESPFGKMSVLVPQLEKILVPLFQQPSLQPNFLDRVREHNVCLENAFVSDPSLFAISGVVRVKNLDFHKSVYVRYSINSWSSFSDLQARYIPNSCDGFSDRFCFMLYAHTLKVGQRMEFAVRFHAAGAQFWDSNGGHNYVFECSSAPPRTYNDPGVPSSPMEACGSFY